MLSRNKGIKLAPEKFQTSNEQFDIIISCEERCFDAILEGTIFFLYLFLPLSLSYIHTVSLYTSSHDNEE